MKKPLFSILLFMFTLAEHGPAIGQAHCSVFNTKEKNEVTALLVTEKYIWIGTTHGIYFRKKNKSRVFHLDRQNSIMPSDTVTCMVSDADGEVYIGTTNGLVHYDRFTFLLLDTENSALKSNRVIGLACLNGKEIYAATEDQGITLFSGLTSKSYTRENGQLSSNHVVKLEKYGEDSLIATLENADRVGIKNRQFSLIDSN